MGSACRERNGRSRSAQALTAALGVVVCLGAVAYAAAPRDSAPPHPEHQPSHPAQPPKPTITQHPRRVATSPSARFGFTAAKRGLRFQCRLDDGEWRACRSPIAFTRLAAGRHTFSVRALNDRGRGGARARFRWLLLEPKSFSIVPRPAGLNRLYPGAPPIELPVQISNPNPVPILVTGLRATATADPPGCASAEHLVLTPSSLSNATPLRVPGGGSANLPAPEVSAPAMQLRDLPFNQDACQNAHFPLAFSGKARG